MEARELRIGNIVEKNGVEYVADHVTIAMAHNYHPIPLTPEILEKCAIVVLGSKWLLTEDKDSHYIWRNDNGKIFYVIDDFGHDGRSEVEIKYLHQLQNLYFALTGEDLKIEL